MEIKFKSQICTTVEQSKKLLELGLKPETADMVHTIIKGRLSVVLVLQGDDFVEYPDIPAWSLHRLMYIISEPYLSMNLNVKNNNLYDHIIVIIENLIKSEKINKEYLNK